MCKCRSEGDLGDPDFRHLSLIGKALIQKMKLTLAYLSQVPQCEVALQQFQTLLQKVKLTLVFLSQVLQQS